VWNPPHDLQFTWQISPSSAPDPNPAHASEVQVRFIEGEEGHTLVEVEHKHIERHGEGSARYREEMASEYGWPYLLAQFQKAASDLDSQRFYHGTKADLKSGDLIGPGYNSNYGKMKKAAYVYLTATLNAATWGAELAFGDGPGRIYMVEPTGPIEDDPNLTDKKYPGNPTKSYRSRDPLRVTGEVTDWQGHSPEELKAMKDSLERLRQLGVETIED